MSDDEEVMPSVGSTSASGGTGRNISKMYQKKNLHEQILLRADMYIGSIQTERMEVWLPTPGSELGMERRSIAVSPGLYKIFDEILVNAADNKQNSADMDRIEVTIDKESGTISVLNTGAGIPVELHPEHGIYVPTLIFGHLLTSSHYDDSEQRVTGGKNGYGAKLANIFSSEFTVETFDSRTHQSFKQTWRNNMYDVGKPIIKSVKDKRKKDFTKVTFKPDFARFSMPNGLDDDAIAFLHKRVYDVAASTDKSVRVKLNGEFLKIRDFKSYVQLFLKSQEGAEAGGATTSNGRVRLAWEESKSGRWQIGVGISTGGDFDQVSFVNSVWTLRGGTHVQLVRDKVTKHLKEKLETKAKYKKLLGNKVRPSTIHRKLFVFVNSLIVNPSFTSQSKEQLKTLKSKFGSRPDMSDAFLSQVEKTGILDKIAEEAMMRIERASKKTDGSRKRRLTGDLFLKLEDANHAGTKHGSECTLILTEGDSAKSLAMAGLTVVGRDKFGVFPLRGVPINVRAQPLAKVNDNHEVKALKQIIGLRAGVKYESDKEFRQLRYGRVMLMTDQDADGSHIKGLLINFIHHFWPKLLQRRGFLTEFVTPIVIARRRNAKHVFYTIPEY
ncbi:MAG: hypothetical protein MHM6MM_006919, partial [Cercozoa sp. M6MM]